MLVKNQEAIQEAYGRFYDPYEYHYSINGWMSLNEIDEKTIYEMMQELNLEFREHTFRPKSLEELNY